MGHVDKPQVFDGGAHASDACPNVDVRVHVMTISGIAKCWTVMAHHKSYCGRLIHLHKMHFQFGVIRASPNTSKLNSNSITLDH